jgi:flagellar basal-body rod modification protein FlgD
VIEATKSSSPSTRSSASESIIGGKESELGRDAFLKLLVTQLTHQDPTQPQSDGEFIAQLATFSQLEQLTLMNKTLEAIGGALGVPTTKSQE